MRTGSILVVCALALGACTAPQSGGPLRVAAPPAAEWPAMNTFTPKPAPAFRRTNASVASDFMALSFQLESGRNLPVLSRFEGPVTVRVNGKAPPTLAPDLARLLTRLRSEARIDIGQVAAGDPANISIEVVPGSALRRSVPNAACFVAPRVQSWSEFRRTRRSDTSDWVSLRERKTMAIFLPDDVSPQEVRDCLHEELAQSLGPVNDLYHLTDSIFNDDNFHAVLTGFDMLILRAYYAPELHAGMSPDQVAAALPGILARINPRGGATHISYEIQTPKVWKDALNNALGSSAGPAARLNGAKLAVNIARAQGWDDNRLAFSLFVLGRFALSSDGALALSSFLQAAEIYGSQPDTKLQAAHIAVQTSAYSLSTGQSQAAINLVNTHFGAAFQAENAGLLATLLMVKAQALQDLGRNEEARIIRLDSIGWARYGIGDEREIRRRLAEIAALSPANRGAR